MGTYIVTGEVIWVFNILWPVRTRQINVEMSVNPLHLTPYHKAMDISLYCDPTHPINFSSLILNNWVINSCNLSKQNNCVDSWSNLWSMGARVGMAKSQRKKGTTNLVLFINWAATYIIGYCLKEWDHFVHFLIPKWDVDIDC